MLMIIRDEELARLVLSGEEGDLVTLKRISANMGQTECLRRMVALFEQRKSAQLCKEAFWTALTICLTDQNAKMDLESARIWRQALLDALGDQNPSIRKTAASCLGSAVSLDESSVNALVKTLSDESEEVRQTAAHALRNAGSRGVSCLVTLLAEYRHHQHHRAQSGGSAWDILWALDEILTYGECAPSDYLKCADAIAEFLASASCDDTLSYLDLWKAGDSLAMSIGGNTAIEKFANLATHEDPRVRASVAHGLGHLKGSQCIKMLKVLAGDRSEKVREEAEKALRLQQ